MSRSIHTTRRDVKRAMRQRYADKNKALENIRHLKEELDQKRGIKYYARTERHDPNYLTVQPSHLLPISILDSDPYIHYPASPDDIRAVIDRLPQGAIDAVREIDLRLGTREERTFHYIGEDEPETFVDPLLGMPGSETMPGIYAGHIRGIYYPNSNKIALLAYIYDANKLVERPMLELYLRFLMLQALVHELAHHHDRTQRMARGRWWMQSVERGEHYAEVQECAWTRSAVIPYLNETYPEAVNALGNWTLQHGGMKMDLEYMISSPSHFQGKQRYWSFNDSFWSHTSMFEELVTGVYEKKPLQNTQLDFANTLHYRDEYVPALNIIDSLLEKNPKDISALLLQADICEHQGRNEDAEYLAKRVLALNAQECDAWKILADVYENTQQGNKLLKALSNIEKLKRSPKLPFQYLRQRAWGRLWTGDWAGFEADLELMKNSGRLYLHKRRSINKLRKAAAAIRSSKK